MMRKSISVLVMFFYIGMAHASKDPIIVPLSVSPPSILTLQQAVMGMGQLIVGVSYHVQCTVNAPGDDPLYFLTTGVVQIANLAVDKKDCEKNYCSFPEGQHVLEFDYVKSGSYDGVNITFDNESTDTLTVNGCSAKTQ